MADLATVLITVGDITSNSLSITAKASETMTQWSYAINKGGQVWYTYPLSDTVGKEITATVTGLTADTSYKIKVIAKKQSDGLSVSSAEKAVLTLDSTVINFVSPVTIDTYPWININWTVCDKSYTHSLTIKSGSLIILSISGLTGSAGTNTKTISLTASQKAAILGFMANDKYIDATYVLTTYKNSEKVGVTSSAVNQIITSPSKSAPAFTSFTYGDSNSTTSAVTGNNQILIQSKSSLTITCTPATPKNGASIAKYRAVIGNKSKDSSDGTIFFGAVTSSGNLTLTVTAIDSRGYETSVTQTITVLEYTGITINSYSVRRLNNVEDTIQIQFAGTLSPVFLGGTAKNNFVKAEYRYKLSDATGWGEYTTMSGITAETSGFSYENNTWIALPADNAYYVQIRVSDKITHNAILLYINKGQPLVAYRSGKVGVNTNTPQSALDVNGDIMMNGINVQGFVSTLGENKMLNDIVTPGIYYATWTNALRAVSNYPSSKVGILEVVGNGTDLIVQRYTDSAGGTCVRTKFGGAWTSWKQISVT